MRNQWPVGLIAVVLALAGAQAQGVSIVFMHGGAAPNATMDGPLVDYLRSLGATVDTLPIAIPGDSSGDALRAAADAHDVVLISESIGSAAPSTGAGGEFHLKNTARPIVSFELFMFDEAKWVGNTTNPAGPSWGEFGNTGNPAASAIGMDALQDTFYIKDPTHPLAAGLSGPVKLYTRPWSVNYEVNIGAGAKVIATADAAGLIPSMIVYETGSALWDESIAPAPRIALFLGQQNTGAGGSLDPTLLFSELTDDAKRLIANSVGIPEPATLALLGLAFGLVLRRRTR